MPAHDPKVEDPTRFAHSTLFEAVPDALVIVDEQGRLVDVNSRAENMFGYSRSELIGKPVEFLMPERFRQRHVGQRDKYGRRPHVRPMGLGLGLYGRTKDGREFPLEISLSPMQTLDGPVVVSAIRDISARRQAPQEVEENAALAAVFTEVAVLLLDDRRGNLEVLLAAVLQRLGEALQVDRVTLTEAPARAGVLPVLHSWTRGDAPSLPKALDAGRVVPHVASVVFSGGRFRFERLAELPADLQPDRTYFEQQGIKSHIALPLRVGNRVVGGLACAALRAERTWPEPLVQQLELLASLIAPIEARRQKDSAQP
ncbi:MAG: PAS domain S-box protein [Gemmatimonadales bacterium]|nr:PAS domain S-box protein [Gemmatimonadales bacterium]